MAEKKREPLADDRLEPAKPEQELSPTQDSPAKDAVSQDKGETPARRPILHLK